MKYIFKSLCYLFSLNLLLFVVQSQNIPIIKLGYQDTITIQGFVSTYQLDIPPETNYFKIKTVPIEFDTQISLYFGSVRYHLLT